MKTKTMPSKQEWGGHTRDNETSEWTNKGWQDGQVVCPQNMSVEVSGPIQVNPNMGPLVILWLSQVDLSLDSGKLVLRIHTDPLFWPWTLGKKMVATRAPPSAVWKALPSPAMFSRGGALHTELANKSHSVGLAQCISQSEALPTEMPFLLSLSFTPPSPLSMCGKCHLSTYPS